MKTSNLYINTVTSTAFLIVKLQYKIDKLFQISLFNFLNLILLYIYIFVVLILIELLLIIMMRII